MSARPFILKSYRARKTAQEFERARYLRKREPVILCRTCYGLVHYQPCAKCKVGAL